MGPIEALELAAGKEAEARDMYEKFIYKYPETKEIFAFLMNEEEKHKELIEKRIVELRR